MTGNCKNSDWEKNQSTKPTKEEDSKTSSDLLKILWDTSAGKPTDGQTLLPNYWFTEDFCIGEVLFGTGNKFQMNMSKLTKF